VVLLPMSVPMHAAEAVLAEEDAILSIIRRQKADEMQREQGQSVSLAGSITWGGLSSLCVQEQPVHHSFHAAICKGISAPLPYIDKA